MTSSSPSSSYWPLEAEREILSDACVPGRHPNALWNFVRYAAGWHYRCVEPRAQNWLTARVHKPFLDWLDSHIMAWKNEREAGIQRRRKVLLWVFRGFGKSNLVTRCVPLYIMVDEPNMTCYLGSETHPKAKEFLSPIQHILAGNDKYSLFTWLYGNWYSPERTWTRDTVVTAYRTSLGVAEPSIGTFGVETGITGKHPLFLNFDDPVSEEKIREGGNFLDAAITSFKAIHPALRNDSMFMFEGTRYRDDDVIGTMLRKEGVASWTGHEPPEPFPKGDWHVYFLRARDINDTTEFPKGRPVLPEAGWTDEVLLKYEEAHPQEYAAQMMGDPAIGEHMELTRQQIDQLIIERKDLPPIEYATIHIDTAFKEDARRAKGDRTAIVGWLHDIRPTGIVYLDKVYCSSTWRSEEFDTHLVSYMLDLKRRGIRIRAITDEKEVGGKRGVYVRHLQNIIQSAGLRPPEIIQFNRAGTRKVVRIREAAGYWLEGYVRLINDCPNLDLLINEMVRIGLSRHDDISDAAADVFRPEVWRGTRQLVADEQPPHIVQPGDDIIKGELERIARQLRGEEEAGERDDDMIAYDAWKERASEHSQL